MSSRAQTSFVQGILTTTAAACTTATSNSNHITLSTIGFGGAVFSLSAGGFTGAVSFYASGDGGSTWNLLSVTPSGGGAAVTTASASGSFQANVSGYTHVCVLLTTDTAGSIAAKINASTVSARIGGGSGGGGGGSVALSSITSATTSPTATASGTNNITWNWQETGAGSGLSIGETAPSTGGTTFGGANNQAILSTLTAANSTASPLWIQQGNLSGSFPSGAPPVLQLTSTWNNAATVFNGISYSINNSASAAGSNPFEIIVNGNNAFSVGINGAVTSSTSFNGTQVTASGNSSFIATGNPAFRMSGTTVNGVLTGGADGGATSQSGAMLVKGADNSSTAAGAGAGSLLLRGGQITNSGFTGANATEGTVEIIAGYAKGTAIANQFDVVCMGTSAYQVTDCSTTPQVNVIGIALSANAPIYIVTDGIVPVHLEAAMTAIGDTVCLSTTTAGSARDSGGQGVCPTAGAQIGVIIDNAGTVQVGPSSANPVAPQTITLSTTQPLVQLHFR